jgi:hypothetical protein
MANPNRRGQVGSEVSTGMQGVDYTPFSNTHFVLPYGLHLRQTINTGTTSVTIPSGITFVYAICVGGGGGPQTNGANGGGASYISLFESRLFPSAAETLNAAFANNRGRIVAVAANPEALPTPSLIVRIFASESSSGLIFNKSLVLLC